MSSEISCTGLGAFTYALFNDLIFVRHSKSSFGIYITIGDDSRALKHKGSGWVLTGVTIFVADVCTLTIRVKALDRSLM